MRAATALPTLLAAVFLLPAPAGAEEPAGSVPVSVPVPGVLTPEYAETLSAAAATNLPVLLFFGAGERSPATAVLRRELFGADEWKAWTATNLFLVDLDLPRDPGGFRSRERAVAETLAKAFDVDAPPALLLLGPDGRLWSRLEIRRGAAPAFYERQVSVARFERDPAALRAALGEERADDYLAKKAALDEYSARVAELRRDLNESYARAQSAVDAAADDAARAAAQEELTRVVGEKIRACRGFQSAGLEAAREAFAALEAYRDEFAGPGGGAAK